MSEDAEALLKRFTHAKTERAMWTGLLQEAYRLGAPNRDAMFQSQSQGDNKSAQRFDSTLMIACRDAARIRHSTITPPFARFFRLAPGPAVEFELRMRGGEAALNQAQNALDKITELFFDALNNSNFHVEVASAYRQEMISTGILRFDDDEDVSSPSFFRFRSVPLDQVYLECGPYGDTVTVWQERTIRPEHAKHIWPDISDLPDPQIMRRSKEDPSVKVTLVEGMIHDEERAAWRHVVLYPTETHRALLLDVEHESTPWIIFSSDMAPGESIGRGPALDVLADAQSLEVLWAAALKDAGLSATGVWQCDDDGVINPAAVRIAPGAIIPKAVGSAGLTPLALPGLRDWGAVQTIIAELRQSVRYGVVGPELPPVDSRQMTATEAERRTQEANLIRVPENTRVYWSLVQRGLVPRGLHLLRKRGFVPETGVRYGLVKPVADGPFARMQQMAEAMDAVGGYSLAAQVSPEGTELAAPAAEFAAWLLGKSNYPVSLVRPPEARAQIREQQAQQQQAMVEAEAMKSAAPMVGAVGKSPELMRAVQGGGGAPSLAEMMGE